MAEITINPFGTGGELPTNIGIVNDLTTGGADKALSAGMGKHLGKYANVSYRGRLSDDINIFDADDFGSLVLGQRTYGLPGGIASVSGSSDPRATFNKYFTIGIDGPLVVGTEYTVHLPVGYWVYLFQVKTTGQTTQDNQILYDWMQDGGKFTFVDGYDYYVLNFAKGANRTETIDLAALAAGFKISSVTQSSDTASASIEILGTNGSATKTIYSDDDSDKVEIYSKDAVDELLGGNTPLSRIIRVATWNIGHLCYGKNSDGGYSGDTAVAMQKAWRNAVNGFAANILCCQEYEPTFGTLNGESVTTADAVMGGIYGYNSIGEKNNYQCQAIFSKSALANGQDIYYDIPYNAQGTYRYQKAETTINGTTVTIIACHFPTIGSQQWDSSTLKATMNEIIAVCADLDYVIVCMDSNFPTTDRFDNFINAGFKLANHGDFGDINTWPSDGVKEHYPGLIDYWPTEALDCIAVKGFKVSNVQIYSDGDLTDHCAIIADLTMV